MEAGRDIWQFSSTECCFIRGDKVVMLEIVFKPDLESEYSSSLVYIIIFVGNQIYIVINYMGST